jgi:hypothetical protein
MPVTFREDENFGHRPGHPQGRDAGKSLVVRQEAHLSAVWAASSRSVTPRIRRNRSLSQARTRDEAEIVADGGEDDVGRIALAALEMTAAEVSVRLHVTDHGLDG